MAVTITLDDVKKIITLDTKIPDTDWQAFVDDATLFIDNIPAIANDCGADTADAVAKYLAAHFMTLRDPRQTEQGTLDASEKFQSKVDLGLDSSHYGQTAKRLDCTGTLARRDSSANSADESKPKHIFQVDGR